jgi:hypothetical protein
MKLDNNVASPNHYSTEGHQQQLNKSQPQLSNLQTEGQMTNAAFTPRRGNNVHFAEAAMEAVNQITKDNH